MIHGEGVLQLGDNKNWLVGIEKKEEIKKEVIVENEEDSDKKVKFLLWAFGLMFMFLPLLVMPIYKTLEKESCYMLEVFYSSDVLIIGTSLLFSMLQDALISKLSKITKVYYCMTSVLCCIIFFVYYEAYMILEYNKDESIGSSGIGTLRVNISFLVISIFICILYFYSTGTFRKRGK